MFSVQILRSVSELSCRPVRPLFFIELVCLQAVLFGGSNSATAGKVWLYNLKAKVWTQLSNLHGRRHGMGVAAFRGTDNKMKVIASAGMHGHSRYQQTEILDVESQTLTMVASFPAVSIWVAHLSTNYLKYETIFQISVEHEMVTISNEPWSFGGHAGIPESMNVQKYDVINDQWVTMGSIPARHTCDAIVYKWISRILLKCTNNLQKQFQLQTIFVKWARGATVYWVQAYLFPKRVIVFSKHSEKAL